MYKHFAIVTVLLTATLAIFASGENDRVEREALEAENQRIAAVDNKTEQTPTLTMSADAKRKTQSRSSSSSNHSISAGYGVPMDQIGSEIQDMRGADWTEDMLRPMIDTSNIPGEISPEVWKRLTPAQQEEARRIFGPSNQLSPEEQMKRQKEMIAASAIRARR